MRVVIVVMRWVAIVLAVLCAGCVSIPRVHVVVGTEMGGVEYRMDVRY